jgi:hypothetical protein
VTFGAGGERKDYRAAGVYADRNRGRNPYGNGKAGEEIAWILASTL